MIDEALVQLGLATDLGGFSVSLELVPNGQMEVRITDEQANVLLARTLPTPVACEERARSAAIVAHSFATTRNLPSRAGALKASLPEKTEAVTAVPASVEKHVEPPRVGPSWGLDVGLGVLALAAPHDSRLNQGFGGGLNLLFRPSRKWSLLGRTLYLGSRNLPVRDSNGTSDAAEASWQRLSAGLGPVFVWPTAWAEVFTGVQGLLAFTTVSGHGLPTNRDDSGWVPGVMTSIGLNLPIQGSVRTALEVGAIVWAGSDRLTLGGADTGQTLPRAEIVVMLTGVLQARRASP
jgi:hypothetical protein